MRVLIIACNKDLGTIWGRHLNRNGAKVLVANNQDEAVEILQQWPIDIIVVDVVLTDGSAIAIADFASYKQPNTKVVFVSNSTFFSDGSIFQMIPNACAIMPGDVAPDDLDAVVQHYGQQPRAHQGAA